MSTRPIFATLSLVLLAGCAGSTGRVYEFRPTSEPLQYAVSDHGVLTIDTPVGEQQATDSTIAVVALEIGNSTASGQAISLSFAALDLWTGGDYPKSHTEGGELIGKRFSGWLTADGVIQVTDTPELPAAMKGADPSSAFADIMLPLPPGGDGSIQSWPHRATVSQKSNLSVTTTYDGTASFAGDTVWEGRYVRVIVSEGIMTATGRGTPAGAPGEVDFSFSGRMTTRYFWDPGEGVMLVAEMISEGEGELEVKSMQLAMPIKHRGNRTVQLQP